jgi:ABC-type nitrate/sulfonate/bicarbonate transport system substrate-binding protein
VRRYLGGFRTTTGWGALAVLAVLCFVLAACGGDDDDDAQAPAGGDSTAAEQAESEQATVRITTPRTVATSIYWALEPFANEKNLEIVYEAGQTFADMQRAIAQGDADAGPLGYTNPAIMADAGIENVKIVAGGWSGSQNVIAGTDSGINDWADLEGSKVGIVPGSYAAIMFTVAAEEQGVNLDEVELVNVTPVGTTIITALERKQIDAVAIWAPIMQEAVESGVGYAPENIDMLANEGLGGAPDGLLGASTDFIANEDVFRRFIEAYVETVEHYQENPDEWATFIQELTGTNATIAEEAVKPGKLGTGLELKIAEAGILGSARLGPEFGYTKEDQTDAVMSYLELDTLAEVMGVEPDSLIIPE